MAAQKSQKADIARASSLVGMLAYRCSLFWFSISSDISFRDTVFQSSFSAATWPADNFIISSVCPDDVAGKDCVDYVRYSYRLLISASVRCQMKDFQDQHGLDRNIFRAAKL